MIGAIVGGVLTILVAMLGFAWYLSARLTSQDIRLTLIERHLKLNGYGKGGKNVGYDGNSN